MKLPLTASLLLCAAATAAQAAKFSLADVQRVTNVAGASVGNKFIVEVSDAANIPTKRDGETAHQLLYRTLEERKISYDVHDEFNVPGIFVGASLTLTDSKDVANLLGAPGVLFIHPVRTYSRPVPVASKKASPGDAGLPDPESTHIDTGVSKLHAQGIFGKGVKIGILDTGVDYTHPFLGPGFGPGHKIAGGYDFVGDAYTGSNTPVPDPDPLDQCAGHGTHVAGIIGANPGNPFNISGVAYEASIYAYRIFGCTGVVQDPVIIQALLMGYNAGMDILTMSLGGPDGWTEGAASVVSSRISSAGRIVTIAAGNDGASGSWYTSSPGNSITSISVASSENTLLPLQTLQVTGVTHAPIVYFDSLPLPVTGTRPLYVISNDTTVVDDACNPLPASTPDLSKFVVLVRRGTCNFVVKLANIAAFGGNVSIIYDNGNGFAPITVGNFQAVFIQAADGVFLAQQHAAGVPIQVSFPQVGGSVNFPDPTGGLVSTFTSYGPSNDLFFKPAITAPGGSILSTWPVPLGSWQLDSGTSMATPFLAGSSALLLAYKGKNAAVAKNARTLFQSTASPIGTTKDDSGPLQTVTQQGAGLIQVFDALFTQTTITPTELLLNDTAHFAGPIPIYVTNNGKTEKDYTLSHVPAGTALTVDSTDIFPSLGPVPLSTAYASVSFNTHSTFTLKPGKTKKIIATITPPTGVDAKTFPVYSGFIYATSGAERVHATYLGLAASLRDAAVLDNTDLIFGVGLPALIDTAGNFQSGPENYTFVGGDAPTLLWRQNFGTPAFRADLVAANISFAPTISARAAPVYSFGHPKPVVGSFAKVPIVGALLELDYITRSDENKNLDNTVVLTNTFANGTVIPNGTYKVLVRALKITGDPTNEADWESWLSPAIGIHA